jgi:hypothetical protein
MQAIQTNKAKVKEKLLNVQHELQHDFGSFTEKKEFDPFK